MKTKQKADIVLTLIKIFFALLLIGILIAAALTN